MTDQDTLSENIQDVLEELCDQGNEAMDEGEFEEAVLFFERALAVLPEPAEEWEPYGWLQAAIGDAHYGMKRYALAFKFFQRAYAFAGPDEVSSFVLLRMGQCCRRTGDDVQAVEYLLRAYTAEGADAFENAEEDLAFLKSAAAL